MPMTRKKLYTECKQRLLTAKEERLAEFQAHRDALRAQISGDDGDVAQAIEGQDMAVNRRERVLKELREIEEALSRLERGDYGFCEETEEPIEPQRLLALPWTRLSLEGALQREREVTERRVA